MNLVRNYFSLKSSYISFKRFTFQSITIFLEDHNSEQAEVGTSLSNYLLEANFKANVVASTAEHSDEFPTSRVLIPIVLQYYQNKTGITATHWNVFTQRKEVE